MHRYIICVFPLGLGNFIDMLVWIFRIFFYISAGSGPSVFRIESLA